ncbi:Small Conductance Mechanosensitive Ion channel [Ectocarpus siliculosus]|uniref:Small Conductance Mechanosensitive Ion channel n=1 Tax=Ectocarpus siliculosus TaxID=2880 RepID=D7FX36_ECTSI|nr:Small Conductance Mechanosensitive Ion channel [Ectocarpus siliculosus]|eukprot:CBJ26369.1 Small Conductance Mechanosensitive Ion channel [Ectocarpus siliculosus]
MSHGAGMWKGGGERGPPAECALTARWCFSMGMAVFTVELNIHQFQAEVSSYRRELAMFHFTARVTFRHFIITFPDHCYNTPGCASSPHEHRELSNWDLFSRSAKSTSSREHSKTTSGSGSHHHRTSQGGPSHKKNASSLMGFLWPSPAPVEGRPPSGQTRLSAADVVGAKPFSGETKVYPASASGRRQTLNHQGFVNPHHLEEGGIGGGVDKASRHPATGSMGHVSGRMSLPNALDGVRIPATPPQLNATENRPNLVHVHDTKEERMDTRSETELMIGEIKSIQITDEIVLARKALVLIFVSLVGATLFREFAGPFFYFVVALHQDISMTIWSIASMFVWRRLFAEWVYPTDSELSGNAYRYGDEFFQSSILAQYILLLLTDYATTGECNPDDQKFAIEMGRRGIKEQEKISLYAVSKAMGFIPRHKLGHAFFRELGGTNTLNSSRDAKTLGEYMFDQLLLRSRMYSPGCTAPASPATRRWAYLANVGQTVLGGGGGSNANTLNAKSFRGGRLGASKRASLPSSWTAGDVGSLSPSKRTSSDATLKPAPWLRSRSGAGGRAAGSAPREAGGRSPIVTRVSSKLSSSVNKMRMGPNARAASDSAAGAATATVDTADASDAGSSEIPMDEVLPSQGGGGMAGFREFHGGGKRALSVIEDADSFADSDPFVGGESKAEVTASCAEMEFSSLRVVDAMAPRYGHDVSELAKETANGGSFSSEDRNDKDAGGASRGEGSAGGTVQKEHEESTNVQSNGSTQKGGDSDEADKPQEEELLTRETLCPMLEHQVLEMAFKIFDLNSNGSITKAFVWLSILGFDVLSLSVTFASFLIAFSFMIGTAASNLMSAVLFIFVSRLYDVGDRVHIYDDVQTAGVEPMNVVVVKVDLRTTSFRRWDEQIFYIPNHLLADKTIVNIQRTAHQWHEFYIHVAATTSSQKLETLHDALQKFAKKKDKPEGLHPRMGFSLTGIEDSTRLSIRIIFRQRGNWQNMDKKWACQSMCTWAIKNACDTIGITYYLPEVPIVMKNKIS